MTSFYDLTEEEMQESRQLTLMVEAEEVNAIVSELIYEAAKERIKRLYERAISRKLETY